MRQAAPRPGTLLGEEYAPLARRAWEFAERELQEVESEPEDPGSEDVQTRRALSKLAGEGLLAYAVPPGYAPEPGGAGTTPGAEARGESGSRGAPARAAALTAQTNGGPPSRGESGPEVPEVRSIALLREILAYHSGLADVAFAMQGLGSLPIALAGSPELRQRWLPAVARGEAVAALAITEPGAGSDLGSIALHARSEGGDYVLDGIKTLISNAPIADLVTVVARTAPGGSRGLSAFAIPGDHSGLDRRERLRAIAPHPIGALRFTGCRVPASWRLGEEGEGVKIALATLARFRPTVGAAAVGLAGRALDEAIERARGRVQFGRPLAEFEGIQGKLADMATLVEASRLLVYRAAARLDSGERGTLESSMAKLFATEAASQVADEAVQIFGGMGVLHGTRVERIYREVRALRIYEGTSEIQRSLIAREILEA